MPYHKMLEQKNHLLKEIQNLQQLLASCPDGELICAKNGNYITYIHSRSGGGMSSGTGSCDTKPLPEEIPGGLSNTV